MNSFFLDIILSICHNLTPSVFVFQTYSHEVYFDRDTIIHTVQEKNNTFCCHVYKMKRRPSD